VPITKPAGKGAWGGGVENRYQERDGRDFLNLPLGKGFRQQEVVRKKHHNRIISGKNGRRKRRT